MLQETKDSLQATFTIKDLSELKYFLGLKFSRSKEGIFIHQIKYAWNLLLIWDLKF